MKKWMSVLLSAIILCGCGKAEEQPKEKSQEIEKKPEIEVKVKPPKDEKSKKDKQTTKKNTKKTKQNQSKEDKVANTMPTPSQTEPTYDTERYNTARLCLITPGKENEADCQDIMNTPEYSKAWNNLTSEGYICQSGQCNLAQQQATEEQVVEQKEPATNEVQNTVPIETQVIPAQPAKDKPIETQQTKPSVESPKTTETVEQKTDEVQQSTTTTEPRSTKTPTTEESTQTLNATVQDDKDANNQ